MNELPPYDPGASCPKCGAASLGTKYSEHLDPEQYDLFKYYRDGECLIRKCARCKYARMEATVPPNPDN